MTNLEKQADEILALKSIFDQKFRLLDHNQYEILIDFDLIQPFSIHYNNQTSTIKYLPPFSLIIHYHDEYPSHYPPSFILSCFYFSKSHLQNLCQKLDNYSFIKDEICVYDWIQLIRGEITDQIILQINEEEQMNDPRALNGYLSENLGKIYQYLINYNNEYEEKQFRNQLQTCLICTDIIGGRDCIRLHRCGHFYCQSCLNNYVKMTLENGKFGEKVLCPENACKQPFLPNEVKLVLRNDELYERYDRLTLQHGLELMNDIVWCPRCQLAVLGGEGDDNLAMCDQCRYTFCKKCKEVFHSQTMCPKEYAIEQERLRKEKERERIRKRQEEAIANLKKIEEEKKSAAEKKVATQKYREIVINLSEQEALLEEVLNAERIESLNTQYCPKCHVRIEKNGGCSHMHCSRCDHLFTWQAIERPQSSNVTSLLTYSSDNPTPIESIKKELNNEGAIVKTSEQKIEKIDSDETEEDENEQNSKILINNRSVIGSAIVNRVKPCPFKSCKKLNIKVDQDNWILCRSCMKQYCFLCGRGIHGIGHFDKKCKRYTPI